MIVLDTNVLSELMKAQCEPRVYHWVSEQPRMSLFTTTITQAEVLYGLAILPPGQRKEKLLLIAHQMFAEEFPNRLLPFDADAAVAYAQIASERKQFGQPISQFDAQIAAICRSRNARLAT